MSISQFYPSPRLSIIIFTLYVSYHILLEQLRPFSGTFLDFVPKWQVRHIDERNYDNKNGASQSGLKLGYKMVKRQGNRSEHLQNEIHYCCLPEFWSFFSWKTPDTQNAALKDTKWVGNLIYLITETYWVSGNKPQCDACCAPVIGFRIISHPSRKDWGWCINPWNHQVQRRIWCESIFGAYIALSIKISDSKHRERYLDKDWNQQRQPLWQGPPLHLLIHSGLTGMQKLKSLEEKAISLDRLHHKKIRTYESNHKWAHT